MFKYLALLSLWAVAVTAQTPTAAPIVRYNTQAEIEAYVRKLQQSKPAIISQSALDTTNSYQERAMRAAKVNLQNENSVGKQVREYYVLACLFYATNGVTNKFTTADSISPVPQWTTATNWITNKNYCKWFGVQCFSSVVSAGLQATQEANQLVIEINLDNNGLAGALPNEISLLGSHLQAMDFAENDYMTTNNYEWMKAMTATEALFFADTSWEANPIPVNLRFMTRLVDLEFRNTYWGGVLTTNAFNNLKNLQYLDMGQTFVDTTGLTTLPDSIVTLPNLKILYANQLRPTANSPAANNKFVLTFIQKMAALEELWFDQTNVRGPMPSSFGKATRLRALSLTYCKLTGTVPAAISTTMLEEMYLFGNPNLKGALPSSITTLDWRKLYIEGTGITGTIPKGLCDQVGPDINTQLSELGADAARCPSGCCTCTQAANTFGTSGCGNLLAPTPAPGGVIGICFSGDSQVEVENQGLVKMAELALGDSVKVAGGKFEPIYSFGHKNAEASDEFLQIVAEGRNLEISKDHMVLIEGGRNVPASMVKKGDMIVAAAGNLIAVKDIRVVTRRGVFAPFTKSGSIVVNGVTASNYIAYQGSEYLKVAGVETPLSYQFLAHAFNSVHRIAYKMGFTTETYTIEGTSTWVAGPHQVGSWLLEQSAVVVVALLLPAVAFFGFASFVESLMDSPMAVITMAVGILSLLAASRTVTVKMSKKM